MSETLSISVALRENRAAQLLWAYTILRLRVIALPCYPEKPPDTAEEQQDTQQTTKHLTLTQGLSTPLLVKDTCGSFHQPKSISSVGRSISALLHGAFQITQLCY